MSRRCSVARVQLDQPPLTLVTAGMPAQRPDDDVRLPGTGTDQSHVTGRGPLDRLPGPGGHHGQSLGQSRFWVGVRLMPAPPPTARILPAHPSILAARRAEQRWGVSCGCPRGAVRHSTNALMSRGSAVRTTGSGPTLSEGGHIHFRAGIVDARRRDRYVGNLGVPIAGGNGPSR